jgi:drug/metabolite transporter (DMT)-like permease
VAALLCTLLLDERFTLGLAVGLPVVVLGCVLATRRSPVRTETSELADVDAAVP